MTDLLKQAVRAAVTGVFRLIAWAAPEDEEEEEYEVIDGDTLERDAAYLTTGMITAARLINTAHEEGSGCQSHHEAAAALFTSIEHPLIAIRVIQHLLEIVAQSVDDEDVQRMVASIVATELGEDDEDDEDDIHHHH